MDIIYSNHTESFEHGEKFALISNNNHGMAANIKKLKANVRFPEGLSKQLA